MAADSQPENHQPSTVAVGRRLSPQERRQRLLSFGCAYFAVHRYDDAPMDEIARRAGVSKALLYHYFGGRRGFYIATVQYVIDGALASMRDAGDGVSALLRAFVRYSHVHSNIYRAIVRGGLGADDDVQREADRVRGYVVERLAAMRGREPTARERIGVAGWVAFVEVAVAEWLAGAPLEESELLELLESALAPVFADLSVP